MDAPKIQYAKTSDGVSIAYWTMGEGGTPLVYLFVPPFTHIEQEWHFPGLRESYQRMATKRMFVRYDGRGSGMSERDVTDFSLEARLLDLQAVVERLALQRFALYGAASSGLTAITYAARHPERVSHLILMDTYARGSDLYNVPQFRGLLGLLENDWETFTEALASVGFGWNAGDPARRFAAFLRQCVTPQVARAYGEAAAGLDLTDALSQISSPTLVIQRRGVPFPSMDTARATASRIPDARLVVREGTWLSPEGIEGLARVVEEFLSEGEPAETPKDSPPLGTAPPEAGIGVILFLDIAGSTELTTQIGDAAYREKERQLDGTLRQSIREAGGSPVEGKVLGDGVMAVFSSAKDAIDAALKCQALGDGAGLPLHAAIHAGDVIREGNNVHGGAVQIAARIADASAPGETLVSGTVRDLARTSAGVSFDDRGERELKGVSEPVRVFAVREA